MHHQRKADAADLSKGGGMHKDTLLQSKSSVKWQALTPQGPSVWRGGRGRMWWLE